MAAAALQLLVFFVGVSRRSYLALALPVTVAMLAQSALTFWLGWTMLSMTDTEETPPST
jgi:hypothetical protein